MGVFLLLLPFFFYLHTFLLGNHLMCSFFLLPLVPGFGLPGLPLLRISAVTEPRAKRPLPLISSPLVVIVLPRYH
jgi:hypothetical protein